MRLGLEYNTLEVLSATQNNFRIRMGHEYNMLKKKKWKLKGKQFFPKF